VDGVVILFGLGVGVLIGLTGIGGGSLMTPLLIIVAGIKPTVAIGTDLAYGAITKTLGGWRVWRDGQVDLTLSKWLAFGSVPGSVGGVIALSALHHAYGDGFDSTLLYCVAGALLVAGLGILFRALLLPGAALRERPEVPLRGATKALATSIGLVLGFMLGLTSVGSGALIGLALIVVFRLTPHRVVGTDVFHAAILLWVAGLAHWFSGNVDFHLMLNILIGSLPGVYIGTLLLPRVSAGALRPVLGCVLLGSALGVMSKAGLDVPAAAIVGGPLLAGLAAWLAHRARRPKLVTA
jgi:uncharacterized membrane protein YfcA